MYRIDTFDLELPFAGRFSGSGRALIGNLEPARDLAKEFDVLTSLTGNALNTSSSSMSTNNTSSDDFAGDASTTGVLTPNGAETFGRIDFDGDVDWFRIDVAMGMTYVFNIDNPYDIEMSLVDANGSALTSVNPGDFQFTFNATTDDTLYLSLENIYFYQAFDYNVSVVETQDDYGNTAATAGTITPGTSVTGTIEYDADEDWFAISLNAGDVVIAEATDAQGNNIDVNLQLVTAGGSTGYPYSNSTLAQQVTETGVYYIAVQSGVQSNITGTQYTLNASISQDDYAGDNTTTGVVTLGQAVSFSSDFNNDSDAFVLTPTSTTLYSFSETGHGNFALYTMDGSYISSIGNDGFEIGDTGVDYLVVAIGSYRPASQQQFTIAAIDDDFGSTAATSGTIAVGESINGRVDIRADRDWFGFDAVAGEVVAMTVDNPNMRVRIVDADGNTVTNEASGFEVSTTGTYYVQVSSYSPGAYALSMSIIDDDYSGDTSTTGLLSIANDAFGRVDYQNDSDWFAFTGTAGSTVRFSTDLAGADLTLYDAFGISVAYGNEVLGHDFTTSGTYFVGVNSYFGSGAYTLAAEAITDDFADNTSTTGRLTLNGSASGRIDIERDTDWFAITVSAGQVVEFTSNNDEVDLRLMDASGDWLRSGDDIAYEFISSGTYFVSASSGDIGDYTLSSRLITDDFSATTSTTGRINADDTATGTIEYEGDDDWFRFTASEAGIYAFSLQNPSGTYSYADLSIYDSSGQQVNYSGYDELILNIDAAGTYYISVSSSYLPVGQSEGYTLVSRTIEDTYGDSAATAGQLADGVIINSRIDFEGDTDWFAVNLVAGISYAFTTTSSGSYNPEIQLVNANGVLIGNDYDGSLVLDAFYSGTYYVSLSGFDTFDYTLSLDVTDRTDTAYTLATTGPVADTLFVAETGVLFISTEDGLLHAFNTRTDTMVWTQSLGGKLGDIEMSADGGTLYVTQQEGLSNGASNSRQDNTITNSIYQVTASTGAATELNSTNMDDNFGHMDFALTGNGELLFTNGGQQWAELMSADTTAAGFGTDLNAVAVTVESSIRGGTAFETTRDGRYVLMAENNISSFDLRLYDSQTGTTLRRSVDGFDRDNNALSSEAEMIALQQGTTLEILDFTLATVTTLNISAGTLADTAFSADGDYLFVLIGEAYGADNRIDVYHTQTFARIATFNGLSDWSDLEVDAAGDILFVGSPSGVSMIALGELAQIVTGTEAGEILRGASGNDTLYGRGGVDVLLGRAGDDTIYGDEGDDRLYGEAGNDALYGGTGDDTLFGGAGADVLDGGAGRDVFLADGTDSVSGGEGYDRLIAVVGSGALDIDMTASELEYVIGSQAGDVLDASAADYQVRLYSRGGDDVLHGGSDHDRLYGEAGDDILNGGAGNDALFGGAGADVLNGGDGIDYLYADADDTVDGGAGYDRLFVMTAVGASFDIGAAQIEYAIGNAGADAFDASSSAGTVRLFGRGGDDVLTGGAVRDFLYGQDGDDVLDGGGGADFLFGGAGNDTYVFGAGWGSDRVVGFEDGADLIDMSALGITFADLSITELSNGFVRIVHDGQTLILDGVDFADIDAADFIF